MAALPQLCVQRSMSAAQARAQAYAEATQNSTISITRPASATYDEVARKYTKPAMGAVYNGSAGITIGAGPITLGIGDEPTYYDSCTVYIPHDPPTLPRIDDVVLVLTSPDVDLVGRSFRITNVPVGGRITTSIALSATGIAPSRQWS